MKLQLQYLRTILYTSKYLLENIVIGSKINIGGCRCGVNLKKVRAGMPPRSYKSGKRCKCVKADLPCSNICNCHGECGGRKCGGSPKDTEKRSGRKRKKHELQKTKTCSSNKEFLDNMMEDIKLGKVNLLEYIIICAIVLFLEANAGHSYILDVKNFYDMILSLVKTYNIMLPLTCRTLLDIEKAIRQVFAIRKGMKF